MATRVTDGALVSRVSRLRRSRARALLSGLNLKKKRDCSQSIPRLVRTTFQLDGIITRKKKRILKRTPSGSFVFKRPTCSSRDMRNCTRSVRSFQFPQESGSTTRLSSFFSLAMFSTVEAGLITEDVSIIDQTRGGVGAPLNLAQTGMCMCYTRNP